MHRSFYLLSTVAVAAAFPVHAQEPFDLGELILSGSLTPVQRGNTGATVEVLTGDDAGASDTSVITRLDRLPGVNSTANGGLGTASSIQIRGLPARYVGVRINGIDVADPSGTQSQYNFGGLTSSGIGRIEVLKGSQSALYGSETIGGLVDITTWQPEELGFSGEAGAEAGTFDTYSGTLSMGYRGERGHVALSFGRLESDGISSRAGDAEDDGFEQTTVSFSTEHAVTDVFTLGGAIWYRDGSVEIDRSAVDNTGINYFEERGIRTFARLETGIVTHTLSYSYFDVDRKDPGGFTTRFTGERQNVAYLGSARFSEQTVLNFGVDHTREKYKDPGLRASEDNTALQAELLVSPSGNVDISAALRYDDNSDFGGKATGRLAAVWRPVEDVAVRAVAGTGFRAPSLFERFSIMGMPTLKPEQSRSFELGVEKMFGTTGSVQATAFYTEVDDLIDFDGASVICASGFGCFNQVPGTTKSKGIELSGEYAPSGRFSVYGNYTYTDARTRGARLSRTPRHDIVVGVSNDFTDRLTGYLDVRHVADVVASPFAPANHKVGDYTLVGAGVSYAMTDSTEMYLRVENLFDEDYEVAGGYNTPGRAAYFGIRARF